MTTMENHKIIPKSCKIIPTSKIKKNTMNIYENQYKSIKKATKNNSNI